MSDALVQEIERKIIEAIPDAQVEVTPGTPGHYSISVVSEVFREGNTLTRQRKVYSAIKDLMGGDQAPLHAVDQLITKAPG